MEQMAQTEQTVLMVLKDLLVLPVHKVQLARKV
jgi:hypothetical protein